ncbi:MAG: hypothetical protein WBV72_06095, partial [Nitrososphaeraceae archaeon]
MSKINTNTSTSQLPLPWNGTCYRNFINAIKSPATKEAYETSLRRYLNHIKQKTPDDLLVHSAAPRY